MATAARYETDPAAESEIKRLRAALEASSDTLRLITSFPGDVRAVLDGIAARAAALCGAIDVGIFRLDGDRLRPAGSHGPLLAAQPPADGHPLTPDWAPALAVLERRVVHIADVTAPEAAGMARSRRAAERFHWRSTAVAPLLIGTTAVGAMSLYAAEPGAFTGHQLALLESFASQAAMAIEHARLFAELQDGNATLKDALDQQTATAEILRAIAASPADLGGVLREVVVAAVRVFGAAHAAVFRTEGGELVGAASHWADPALEDVSDPSSVRFPLARGMTPGRAVLDGRSVCVDDLLAAEAEFPDNAAAAQRYGFRTVACAPLQREGETLGVLSVERLAVRPLTVQEVSLLQTFADQAVIAIENARLFSELQESNATLNDALEQQTATAEVLRVISASPGDRERALDAITASAAHLCQGDRVTLRLVDGDEWVFASTYPAGEAHPQGQQVGMRQPLRRGERSFLAMNALFDARTLHVPDVLAEAPDSGSARIGERSLLFAPLLRDGTAIGVIGVARTEQRPFTPQQIALLETYASQAVIALENARLFSELRERDERRRQELERAAAIQQRLLPDRVEGWPGVLEVAVRFRPAVETSGDFYDVLPLSARKGGLEPLQIAVGDVAGKGMSAALVTALARAALHATASVPTRMVSPGGVLREAGARLHRDVGSSHFVACSLGVVEPPGTHNAGPLLRLANAAQVPVLLLRDGAAEEIEPLGYRLPLGAQDDGAYEDAKIELQAGDVVLFSSDGLVEAPALATAEVGGHLAPPLREGDLFGFERLAVSAAHWSRRAASAEAVAEGIWGDLTAWCGEESHHDDVTLLVLRVSDAGTPVPGASL